MVGRGGPDNNDADARAPVAQSLNEALKNPLILIFLGALSGGTGTTFFVDDSDRFRGADALALEARIDRRLKPLERHIESAEAWKDVIRNCAHDCARCQEDVIELRESVRR